MIRNICSIKKLTPFKIDTSPEINEWLSQFPENKKPIAKLLLSRLKFVSRDSYSEWLNQIIVSKIDNSSNVALYSIRKLTQESDSKIVYWDKDRQPIRRPGDSLGSEDLVYSLISNLARLYKDNLLDHPSLIKLKSKRIRDYILIDDSIGSGDRVVEFINSMLNHPTFLSWWSLGWVKIHIISFARTVEAEKNILMNIKGSTSSKRKIKKSSKITFMSKIVYQRSDLHHRWGENYEQIYELCKTQKKIRSWARLGYGNVFSNIIFYHSVPNNIPGVIWFENSNWKSLMPHRALPLWLINLLDFDDSDSQSYSVTKLSSELLSVIKLIKKGIRNSKSIAQRLDIDAKYTKDLLQHMVTMGLITENTRLTSKGLDIFHKLSYNNYLHSWDFNLYIPSSWCADSKSI